MTTDDARRARYETKTNSELRSRRVELRRLRDQEGTDAYDASIAVITAILQERAKAAQPARDQVAELANTIALQAQAIAAGTTKGPVYGAVQLVLANAQLLHAITPDDRS